jgi:palmitoyl-protein thioesterase
LFYKFFLSTFKDPTPVVIWHGMGDSCCNPSSMGRIKEVIEETTNGYVISIMIGGSVIDDTINGFLKPVNKQVIETELTLDQDYSDNYNVFKLNFLFDFKLN